MPRGNNDEQLLPDTGNALSYGPTWMKYRVQLRRRLAWRRGASTWPAASPCRPVRGRDRRSTSWRPTIRTSRRSGRRRFTLPNGTTQPNPLATRNRYVYSDRGEGQVQAPAITTVGLKIGKRFSLGAAREVEIAGNIFNLLNGGDYTQYSYNSAYQTWSSNFLLMRNRQPARAFQLTIVGRF